MSSLEPLKINLALKLRLLAAGMSSVSHLMKLALSRKAMLYVKESPFDFCIGVLFLMVLVSK